MDLEWYVRETFSRLLFIIRSAAGPESLRKISFSISQSMVDVTTVSASVRQKMLIHTETNSFVVLILARVSDRR